MRSRCVPAALALALMVSSGGCQQRHGEVIDRALLAEVLTESEFAENLRALSVPGGRLSGTPGAARAEEFVAEQLRAYGLKNVHFEPFEMTCWTMHAAGVTLLGDPERELEGAIALAMTQTTPEGGVTAELVHLGNPEPADVAKRGTEIAGKFAVISGRRWGRTDVVAKALEQGAAGVIFMSPPDRSPIIGNGHKVARPEPLVVVKRDEELLSRLDAGETLSARLELQTEIWPCRPRNVVGEIPGRGAAADEVVMLTAHLDSWHLAEGAMDNGSGSAAILEAARALAASAWRPRRTLRFVWFMSEELGLEGSRAYVAQHADELDRIVAVINADMPGEPRRLVVFHHEELVPLLEQVKADLPAYGLEVALSDSRGMWSDHAPFMREGVCTVAVSGELGDGAKHYHTVGDTYETVDVRGTVHSSAVFAVLLRRLADAEARPTVRRAAWE